MPTHATSGAATPDDAGPAIGGLRREIRSCCRAPVSRRALDPAPTLSHGVRTGLRQLPVPRGRVQRLGARIALRRIVGGLAKRGRPLVLLRRIARRSNGHPARHRFAESFCPPGHALDAHGPECCSTARRGDSASGRAVADQRTRAHDHKVDLGEAAAAPATARPVIPRPVTRPPVPRPPAPRRSQRRGQAARNEYAGSRATPLSHSDYSVPARGAQRAESTFSQGLEVRAQPVSRLTPR